MPKLQIVVEGPKLVLDTLRNRLERLGLKVLMEYPLADTSESLEEPFLPPPFSPDLKIFILDSEKANKQTLIKAIDEGYDIVTIPSLTHPPTMTALRVYGKNIIITHGTQNVFYVGTIPIEDFRRLWGKVPYYARRSLHVMFGLIFMGKIVATKPLGPEELSKTYNLEIYLADKEKAESFLGWKFPS